MSKNQIFNLFWFRRDLRLEDNHGLWASLHGPNPVIPIFIFDTNILGKLEFAQDARVEFIFNTLASLNARLSAQGTAIQLFQGKPLEIFKALLERFSVNEVYTNEDYEPYAIKRDDSVKKFLETKNIAFRTYTDQVIFHPGTIQKDDGTPYTIYTPYMKKWRAVWAQKKSIYYPSETLLQQFSSLAPTPLHSLSQLGFQQTDIKIPERIIPKKRIGNYKATRDIPGLADGTSRLGIHLRFGTLSIRKLIAAVSDHETYVNELIWREFFMQILFHYPTVLDQSFKSKYDRIQWENKDRDWEAWCHGTTGYPMVDAGMRELNMTGHMHNRVRMVTASFLCKHLLIDWRWGEAYFASKLLDFELASNNGNWQWAAGCGCDAAPYFRIFNPSEQQKKFDPDLVYIKKWIPEYGTAAYPAPIVEHSWARQRVLERFKTALEN
jgi:deoxyribodipyrimidine photo-lyase